MHKLQHELRNKLLYGVVNLIRNVIRLLFRTCFKEADIVKDGFCWLHKNLLLRDNKKTPVYQPFLPHFLLHIYDFCCLGQKQKLSYIFSTHHNMIFFLIYGMLQFYSKHTKTGFLVLYWRLSLSVNTNYLEFINTN